MTDEHRMADFVLGLEDRLNQSKIGLHDVYTSTVQAGFQKLIAEGKIKRREGELGYDTSALDKDKDTIDMLTASCMEEAKEWMKNLYADAGSWSEDRMNEEMLGRLGFNVHTLGDAVKAYGRRFSAEGFKKYCEENIKGIFARQEQVQYGKIKGKHAEEIFEHAFHIAPSSELGQKINWDMLGKHDDLLRSTVKYFTQNGIPNKEYLSRMQYWKG